MSKTIIDKALAEETKPQDRRASRVNRFRWTDEQVQAVYILNKKRWGAAEICKWLQENTDRKPIQVKSLGVAICNWKREGRWPNEEG